MHVCMYVCVHVHMQLYVYIHVYKDTIFHAHVIANICIKIMIFYIKAAMVTVQTLLYKITNCSLVSMVHI